MPGRMLAVLVAFVFGGWMALAGAGLACATEPVAADTPQAQAAAQEPDSTKAEPEFKPPPGYKPKTRGDKVVYCRKELVEGTRFTKDRCYDKVQLKEIESLRDQQQREMDQRRRICAACT